MQDLATEDYDLYTGTVHLPGGSRVLQAIAA